MVRHSCKATSLICSLLIKWVSFDFRNNPLGLKGRLAQLYGKLINSLWDGTNRNLPPVELRYTLAKYAPQFNGCQQHDAQELLAFLLDGLHEDLNRCDQGFKTWCDTCNFDAIKTLCVPPHGGDEISLFDNKPSLMIFQLLRSVLWNCNAILTLIL